MKNELYTYQIAITELLKATGTIALALRERGLHIQTKEDNSPLTNADMHINGLITECLSKISNFPIISEEACSLSIENQNTFWIIDPIDGTKPYMLGSNSFATCIALIHYGKPILGMIGVPADNTIYTGINLPEYKDSFFTIYNDSGSIITSVAPLTTSRQSFITILSGKPLPTELKAHLPVKEILLPSAVKFGMLAKRRADAYVRINHKQMDWDIAAGQAILEASGLIFSGLDDQPILYPNCDFFFPEFFASTPVWFSPLKEVINQYFPRHHH